jgi:hypothetical protein
MPLDAATIQAMSGGFTNWDAKRGMAERALQFQRESTNIAENSLHNSQLAQAKLAEYYDTINKPGLLDPDKKKVSAVNDQLKTKIKDGIMKYHGDVSRYMDSGGLTELHEYQQDLINSNEMQRGQSNFYNYNKAKADAAAGLILRQTGDKTFDEHVKEYYDGKTDAINYNGAFERPDIDPRKYFGEVFGNHQKLPQDASPTDVFDYVFQSAKGKGRTIADARQFATSETKGYMAGLQAGEHPYQYKSENPLKDELMRSLIYKNYKKGAGDGQLNAGDFYRNAIAAIITPTSTATNKDNGIVTANYEVGGKWGNGYTNVAGIEYEKPNKENGFKQGVVANHDAFVGRNNLKIVGTNDNLDIKALPRGSYTLEPSTTLAVQYDKNSNIINHGTRFTLHLNKEGLEALKLSTNWGGKAEKTPGLRYQGGPHFWNMGDTNATGDIDVVSDFGLDEKGKPHPQVVTGLEQETQTMSKTPYERNAGNISDSENEGGDNSQYFLMNDN